ncbi:hypothetical protein AVEN_70437-1, partial [Araneus ventricosus]
LGAEQLTFVQLIDLKRDIHQCSTPFILEHRMPNAFVNAKTR